MTIKVRITNEDQRQDAKIRVSQTTADGQPDPGTPDRVLQGTEFAIVHLHSGSQFAISEVVDDGAEETAAGDADADPVVDPT